MPTQTGQSTEQIGAKVDEIQSTTREVVASLAGVAEIIDQLSGVTEQVSAAIEQQRGASENFAVSANDTSAAVSDFAGRMGGIAEMVHHSRADRAGRRRGCRRDAGGFAFAVPRKFRTSCAGRSRPICASSRATKWT